MDAKQTPRPDTAGQPNERALGTSLTQRRRRAAALRLAPFGDGPADPLDDLAGEPIAKPQPCYGVEFGPGGRVKPCCRRSP